MTDEQKRKFDDELNRLECLLDAVEKMCNELGEDFMVLLEAAKALSAEGVTDGN